MLILIGATIHKMIASRCILGDILQPFSDGEFDPIRERLGLIDALKGD